MTPMDLGFSMHAGRPPGPNHIKWVLGRPIEEAVPQVQALAAI